MSTLRAPVPASDLYAAPAQPFSCWASVCALLGATALAACGGTSPSPRGDVASTAGATSAIASADASSTVVADPSAPALNPAVVTVTPIKTPLGLSVDGDPSEWGALDVLLTQTDKAQPKGASHVAVAIDEKAVHLAGTIAGVAKSGLTVALRFEAPELPPVGLGQRGGGVLPLGECEEEIPGFTLPVDDCKEVRAAYDAFVAAYAARYTRVLAITESGISAVPPATKWISAGPNLPNLLAAATFRAKRTATGFTFEADLPLGVLPRLASPSIESIALAARPGAAAPPDDAFFFASLPTPVSFDPHRAVRDWAFRFPRTGLSTFAPSWQPGDWNKVEVIQRGSGGLSLEPTERALYSKLGGGGNIEFGFIEIEVPMVLVLADGIVTGECQMGTAPNTAVKKRMRDQDGWLMVSPYQYFRGESGYGFVAGFDTCFILPDGNTATGIWTGGTLRVWDSVTPTVSPDLETLTLSGQAYDLSGGDTKQPASDTWSLDKTNGTYTEHH